MAIAGALLTLATAVLGTFLAHSLVDRPFAGFLVYPNGLVSPLTMPGWGGPAAGVRYLDRILAVDGDLLPPGGDVWSLLERRGGEGAVSVTLDRKGETRVLRVPVERFSGGDFLALWAILAVTGLAFAAVGGLVLWLKPREATSWTFFAFCEVLALYILIGVDYSTLHHLGRCFLVLTALLPPSCLAMGLTVPETHPWIKRRPRLLALVYLSALPLLVLYQVWIDAPGRYVWLDEATGLFFLFDGVAVPLLIVRTALRGRRSLHRQRAQAILRGMALSFGVSTVLIAGILYGWGRVPISALALASLGVPVSFAWAILRRDFLGLGEVLRLTLGYAAVTLAVVAAYMGLLALLSVSMQHWSAAGRTWSHALLAAVVGLGVSPLYRTFQTRIDRAFFRSQYDFEAAVEGLLRKVSGSLDITQTCEALVALLHQDLNVPTVAVLIRDRREHRYWPIAARGRGENDPALTPLETSPPFRTLERTGQTVTVETLEEAHDREGVAELLSSGFALLLPIAFEGEIYGVVAMGSKRSGRPYTRKDVQLVSALVAQTGVALRNSLLYGEVLLLKQGLEERVRDRTRELEDALERLRRTQAQLVQAGKMAGLGQLVAGVAHEINNPVSVIASGIERLRERVSSSADPLLNGLFEVIQDGARRTREIVANLRTFSRHDEAVLQKVRLAEGLESALRLLHHRIEGHVEIRRSIDEVPPVLCRAGEVNQVFLNLLANALDAVEERGRREGNGYRGRVSVEVHPAADGNGVEAAVGDNGGGIPEALRSRVFDPFFTTKPVGQGTGLGLSLSYDIIAQHGGSLTLESAEGVGTTFRVRLPLEPPEGSGA